MSATDEEIRELSTRILGEEPSEEHYERSKTLCEKGVSTWAAGSHMESIHYFDIAIFLTPSNPEIYRRRGEAKRSLKLHGEAGKDFEEALRLEKLSGK